MGLDILSLAPKSQWAFCEFLSKCFSLLTILQSTWSLSVVTRPHLQTGIWSSCYRGSLFNIAVLLALILEEEINAAHPVSHWAKLLTTFLLKPTSASNEEWLLPEDLVPIGRKDVQWGVWALAAPFIIPNQAPHFLLDVIRHLQWHQVLSNSMGCNIFLGENH